MNKFRVGEWTVEPALGRVRSAQSEVSLQPQVMQLLIFLAEHPREVISIDRMIEEVWAGKPMTSGSVYNALNTLRKAFGDSKESPRYIQTIPRKGYRLVAKVSFSESDNASEIESSDTDQAPTAATESGFFEELKRRNVFRVGIAYVLAAWVLLQITDVLAQLLDLPDTIGRVVFVLLLVGFIPAVIFAWAYELTPGGLRRDSAGSRSQPGRFGLGGFAILTVIAVGLYWMGEFLSPQTESRPDGSAPPEKSIAVLPFADMSPEGDQQYFAEGIAEEILNVIARHPDLKVVGRSSSFQFRGGAADLKEVGETLNVAHVLEGSVRRDGDRLRITAQLIETADGYHLWSETFDTPVGDVFRVQDEIAGQIAEQLQLTVLGETVVGDTAASRASSGLDAYDLFLLARHRIGSAGEGAGREPLEKAIDYLEQAIVLQSDFANAHAELAFAHISLYRYFLEGTDADTVDLEGPALRHANNALALDPYNSQALTSAGIVYYYNAFRGVDVSRNLVKATDYLERALEVNPNNARALVWSTGVMILKQESWLDIVSTLRKAVELDPFWPFASEWYFRWIKTLSRYKEEKWNFILSLRTRGPELSQSIDLLEADAWRAEGRLANAVRVLESAKPSERVESELQRNYFYLGQFDKTGEQLSRFSQLLMAGPNDPVFQWAEQYCSTDGDSPRIGSQDYRLNRVQFCMDLWLTFGQVEKAKTYLGWTINGDLLEFARAQYPTGYTLFLYSALADYSLMMEDQETAGELAELMRPMLDSFSERGSVKAAMTLTAWARYHALQGRDQLAIDALDEALEAGHRDFDIFMTASFSKLADDPRFIDVKRRWLELTNDERAQLGLKPLQLNPDNSPGQLPFIHE